MSYIIDGDKLLRELSNEYLIYPYDVIAEERIKDKLRSIIYSLPEESAAMSEKKKGHWHDCYCSECGWSFEVESGFVGDPTHFQFCPNCGADMREEK